MNHATTCKFCQKPLVIKIDDGYAEMGDPLKLLQYAACNACADLRVDIRRLEEAIGKAANFVSLLTSKQKIEVPGDKLKQALEKFTRKYAEKIAILFKKETIVWAADFPDMIFENPGQWGKIVNDYRRAIRLGTYQTA
jgi:hypothetical protein